MPNVTVITYQGGSGGDMLAAGLNGVEISFADRAHVHHPSWSLKHQEPQITCGQIDLGSTIADNGFDFVTTHLFDPLRALWFPVISIVFHDPQVIEFTILRQMKLQNLKLQGNPNETAYRLIKNAIDTQDWEKAARCWFAMARNYWNQERQYRIENPVHKSWILNFDRIYHDDFVDSLRWQGLLTNIDLIAHNHSFWLAKNLDQNYDSTISSMIEKLQRIYCTERQGSIVYDKS